MSGASDNIRAWWKEKVKFDKNGPTAIAKYEAKCLAMSEAEIIRIGTLKAFSKTRKMLLLGHFCLLKCNTMTPLKESTC